jgi:hypothetical protein
MAGKKKTKSNGRLYFYFGSDADNTTVPTTVSPDWELYIDVDAEGGLLFPKAPFRTPLVLF